MDDYTAKVNSLREGAVARALDTLLGDRYATTVTRVRAEAVLTALAADVAACATDMAHLGLVDTAQAAEMLGITPRRVRAIAASRGLGWQTARDWVFTAQEVEAMGERTPGRPAVSQARYTIDTTPSYLDPPRTYTSRAAAEHDAREISMGYGSTLSRITVLRDSEPIYELRYSPERGRWQRVTV